MKLFWFSLLLSAAASTLVRVNDKNFDSVVKKPGKFTLVDFYADWCRHCMNLMPTIEKLADIYAGIPEVQIVKINGDEDGKKMTMKYDIPGFPTLLLFHGDDKPIEFNGMRDTDSISNFIQQASGLRLNGAEEKSEGDGEHASEPNQVMSLNDDNFREKVLDADYKTFVIFTALWCRYCKEVKPIWQQIANKIFDSDDDIRFGEVDLTDGKNSNAEMIKGQFGVHSLPCIMLFDPFRVDKDGLKRPIVYNDDLTLESLITFVNDETGLSRDYEGKLFANAGRIMSIDAAIESCDGETILTLIEGLEMQFMEHGRDHLVDETILFFKDDMSMTPYYKKVVNKIIAGDKEFFVRESSRLKGLISLEEKNMERSAYDYMQKRLNILEAVTKMRKY